MGYKQGIDRNQQTYWALEDMIKEESMVRVIDRFIETSDLRELGFTKTQAAETGRPGYAAVAMLKLYLYSYDNGIRSSRKLEKETHRNVEVMWLMEGLTPDHSTISEFRRINAKALKQLFRSFVLLCKSWELTGGEAIAQDGSKVRASNSHKNNVKAKTIDERIKRIEEKIAEHLEGMDKTDKNENANDSEEAASPKALLKLLSRKEKLEQSKKIMEEKGLEEISLTDPEARMMGSPGKGFDIAYNLQAAVDSKNHLIVECDVINNPTDRGELSPMIESLLEDGHLSDKTAYLADRGYYSGEDFADVKALMEANATHFKVIVPRQAPPHPKGQPGMFWNTSFIYNAETNTYTCPMRHTLYPVKTRSADTKRRSYNNKEACKHCPQNKVCISGKEKYRNIRRGEYVDICDEADKTYEENKQIYNLRRELSEHPFGTIKRNMNGSYFLLRTLHKVRGEAALLCLAYNVKRAYNVLGFKEIMAKLDARLCRFFAFYDFLRTRQFIPCFYGDSLAA